MYSYTAKGLDAHVSVPLAVPLPTPTSMVPTPWSTRSSPSTSSTSSTSSATTPHTTTLTTPLLPSILHTYNHPTYHNNTSTTTPLSPTATPRHDFASTSRCNNTLPGSTVVSLPLLGLCRRLFLVKLLSTSRCSSASVGRLSLLGRTSTRLGRGDGMFLVGSPWATSSSSSRSYWSPQPDGVEFKRQNTNGLCLHSLVVGRQFHHIGTIGQELRRQHLSWHGGSVGVRREGDRLHVDY